MLPVRTALPFATRVVAAVGLGYLLGTFPTADLIARRVSGGTIDLRRTGTGNPGSANALGVLGARAGAAVLLGDVGKGALACGLGAVVAGSAGAHVAGTAAVGGHCYPVWSGFAGGKGVATSVGQCVATFPAYFAIDAAVAIGTSVIPGWKRRAFAAINVSSACWVIGAIVWWRRGWPNAWGPTPTVLLPLSAAVSSAMILQRFLVAEREASDVASVVA